MQLGLLNSPCIQMLDSHMVLDEICYHQYMDLFSFYQLPILNVVKDFPTPMTV